MLPPRRAYWLVLLAVLEIALTPVPDNPKDYADNLDARTYDRRLRGPVDEATELAIDPQTGMKNYIANEQIRSTRNGEHMYTSGDTPYNTASWGAHC